MSVERQDKILTCKDCGDDFIFTVREQDFYSQKGFENDPARCGPCRTARKRDRGSGAMSGSSSSYGNSMGYSGGGYGNTMGGNYGNSSNYGNRSQSSGGRPGGNFGNSAGYNRGASGNNYGNGGNNYGNGGGYNNRSTGGNYGNSGGGYGNTMGGGRSTGMGNYGEQERKMYPITCANCGVQTEVPFAPRQGVPVFCRSCYNSQKGR